MGTFRPEQPEDLDGIRELLLQVFSEAFESGRDEARLVEDLRSTEAYIPTLSLVAVHEDEIIGHIMFSEVHILSGGNRIPALALAPLGVRKQYRRQGIGAGLVRQGLETARSLEYRAVFVQGNPAFYNRFGFLPAISRGLTMPFPDIPVSDSLVLELRDGSLSAISGPVEYPVAWEPFKQPTNGLGNR